MKRLIVIICMLVLTGCATMNHYPWYVEKKPVKNHRMTRHQVREAQRGIPGYVRVNGKVYKNTHRMQSLNR